MFETKDLIIKKGSIDDVYDMYENLWSSYKSSKYMLWRVSENIDQAKERIVKWLERQKDYDEWFVYEKSTNRAIGFASINKIEENRFGNIGIGLGEKYTTKGYGSQILEFLIDFARNKGAKIIEYSYINGNVASQKLAEKYGFKYFKTDKRVRNWDSKEFDEVFYILELEKEYNYD